MTKKKTKKPLSLIEVWKGLSPVDGLPIVCLATGVYRPSQNGKTGPMIQTWIIPQSTPINEARKLGTDRSVCGDCAFRGGACYVDSRPMIRMFKDWKEGKAESLTKHKEAFRGRAIRWGAFGDPALLPFSLVQELNGIAYRWTGYTHQWDKPWCDQRFKAVFMASVETPEQAIDASIQGWRTFRVVPNHDFKIGGLPEIPCPADSAFGPVKTNCLTCGLCDGAGNKPSIVVLPHGGAVAKREALKRVSIDV